MAPSSMGPRAFSDLWYPDHRLLDLAGCRLDRAFCSASSDIAIDFVDKAKGRLWPQYDIVILKEWAVGVMLCLSAVSIHGGCSINILQEEFRHSSPHCAHSPRSQGMSIQLWGLET